MTFRTPLYFGSFWSIVLGFIVLLSGFYACESGQQGNTERITIDYNDAVLQQIRNLQDKRNMEGLLPFLSHENPSYRYAATLAFASVQDTAAVPNLAARLGDNYEQVRIAAAFALGQCGSLEAANVLADAFQKDSSRQVQGAILEAVGRCGNEEYLKHVCTAPPYPLEDTVLLEGQARGIYNFALRGLSIPEGTGKMIDYLSSNAVALPVRKIAAHYLARARNIDLARYQSILFAELESAEDPVIQMQLALGVAKTRSLAALPVLKKLYDKTTDARVQINILRGFRYFAYDTTRNFALEALKAKDLQVRITAADYLEASGSQRDVNSYLDAAEQAKDWQVQQLLYAAALRWMAPYRSQTRGGLSYELIKRYKESENLYEKGYILKTLAYHPWNYVFISRELFPLADTVVVPPVLKTYATEALVRLRTLESLPRLLGLSTKRVTNDLDGIFRRGIEQGDPAVMGIIANMFAESEIAFKEVYPDYQFLTEAQRKLELPKHIETYVALQKAIDRFSGKTTPTLKPAYDNSIDWAIVLSLSESSRFLVQTDKGEMELRLFSKTAPGTVAQFVRKAQEGFYNDKVFHRIVPNFVAQTGCPRGDGWGSSNDIIRSEFGLERYDRAGLIGMASAGQDTESVQWFITHRPTPHLNGRYTLFGEVTKGLDVAQKLQIGDRIQRIEMRN